MNKTFIYFLMLLGLVGLAFYLSRQYVPTTEIKQLPPPLIEPVTEEVNEPAILYPVPDVAAESGVSNTETTERVLPALDESDESIQAGVSELSSMKPADSLFRFENFIRHFVVTVDNLPQAKISQRYVFTHRPAGQFAIVKAGEEERYTLNEDNYRRYKAYLDFAQHVSDDKLLDLYIAYYSLFQEAYEELGYPQAYFNDRLVQVIDHLLSTPDVQGEIHLIRPKVFFQFADPELESLSAGQKILLRMGRDNRQRLTSRLQSLRQRLTNLQLDE